MTQLESHLYEVIAQCKIAMPGMIKHLQAQNLGMHGRYSDELKEAIATAELVATVEVPEHLKL